MREGGAGSALSAIFQALGEDLGESGVDDLPRGLFDVGFLFQILVACLLGGAGTISGPIAGAFFLTFLLEWLRPYIPGPERFLIYGAVALFLYVIQPNGLHALVHNGISRMRQLLPSKSVT